MAASNGRTTIVQFLVEARAGIKIHGKVIIINKRVEDDVMSH